MLTGALSLPQCEDDECTPIRHGCGEQRPWKTSITDAQYMLTEASALSNYWFTVLRIPIRLFQAASRGVGLLQDQTVLFFSKVR